MSKPSPAVRYLCADCAADLTPVAAELATGPAEAACPQCGALCDLSMPGRREVSPEAKPPVKVVATSAGNIMRDQ